MKTDSILTTKELAFITLLVIGNGLTITAFTTLDKVGILFFAPGMLILTCTLCVTGAIALLRRTSNIIVRGAFIGLLFGGIMGASGLLQPIFFFLAYKAQGGVGAFCCGGGGALIGALTGCFLRDHARRSQCAPMQFWHLQPLKDVIKKRPLSELETFKYFLACIVLELFVHTLLLQQQNNALVTIQSIMIIAIVIRGTVYCYQKNRGHEGQYFLQRYFAVGWVLSIRFLALFLIVWLILTILFILFGIEFSIFKVVMFPITNIMSIIVGIMLYWRLGHHIEEISTMLNTRLHETEKDTLE